MHKLTLIKLVTSITLQALISVFAYKFVYQYNTLTVLTGIFCLGALLRLRKMKYRILKTGQKVLYLAGRICLTVGLFILINNVFVMKVGKKNCSSCATNTVLGIVGAGILLFYYFCVWVFFTYCDYKEYEKSVE